MPNAFVFIFSGITACKFREANPRSNFHKYLAENEITLHENNETAVNPLVGRKS